MAECKCTMAISILGDGCEVCNPAQALEYAKERLTEVESKAVAQALRILELEKVLRSVREDIDAYSGLRNEYQDWTSAREMIDSALMESK